MTGSWRAVVRRPVGVIGLLIVAAVVVVAVIGPQVWADAASAVHTGSLNQGVSAEHWFGTDSLGRDIFARVMVATRLSLALALVATVVGVVLGVVVGSGRVLLGPVAGRAVDVIINVTNAFPSLLMVLFFAAVFGVNTTGAVLALALATAPVFARLTWTLTASVESLGYVDAAKVIGVGRPRILVRHVLPNVAEALILNATLCAGTAMLAFGGLSFLGIGIQPPQYDYGRLLNDGFSQFYVNPMAVLGPAAAVILAGLGFNFLGEAAAHSVSGRTSVPATRKTPDVGGQPVRSGSPKVLCVEDLVVTFGAGKNAFSPVRGVSLEIAAGDSVGVVGESGSGKSLTALGIAELIEAPGRTSATRLEFDGNELRTVGEAEKNRLLGTALAVVFQNPMTSFNPIRRIGQQLSDGVRHHLGMSRAEARERVVGRLGEVGLPDPARRAERYPFEFSGGMQQRAMIAMGLMGSPRLIIADEPTTALDVTTQSRVLKLLKRLCEKDNAALLLISHDIAVIKRSTRRVLVMYAGRVIEDLPAAELETKALHPYTAALLSAVPDLDTDRSLPLTVIPGRAPDPSEVGPGCPFAPRCLYATDLCLESEPGLVSAGELHRVACFHPALETTRERPTTQGSLV
jgi:oligopeptide/dipeptide ABC transporter ATP-binding protein